MRITSRIAIALAIVLVVVLFATTLGMAETTITPTLTPEQQHYQNHEVPIILAMRAAYQQTPAQSLVGRAIWYMEFGFMKYGHTAYSTTGYIDCSQFVSRVYGDYGYTLTTISAKYNQVGSVVEGVYSQLIPGTTRYKLVGTEKLQPGDIFTWWTNSTTLGRHISHVGIYIGQFNGKTCVINTMSGHPTAIGIVDNFSWWYGQQLNDVRRVLPDTSYRYASAITKKTPVIPQIYQITPTYKIVMPWNLRV
ncbi:MAG: NlpC/P60 family protein, partial [Candidatus Saccharibacteria bacterium]